MIFHRINSNEDPPDRICMLMRINENGEKFDAMMVAGSVGIRASSSGTCELGAGLDTLYQEHS